MKSNFGYTLTDGYFVHEIESTFPQERLDEMFVILESAEYYQEITCTCVVRFGAVIWSFEIRASGAASGISFVTYDKAIRFVCTLLRREALVFSSHFNGIEMRRATEIIIENSYYYHPDFIKHVLLIENIMELVPLRSSKWRQQGLCLDTTV